MDQAGENFMRLYAAHQRRIYGFIRSLVVNATDADDLMQETAGILWHKFDQFQPGTDFGAWALQIARLEIYKHREKRGLRGVVFDQTVFDALADDLTNLSQEINPRLDSLRECIAKLNDPSRRLLNLHYQEDLPVKAIAERVGKSHQTIYRSLSQIYQALLKCIRLGLNPETSP